MRVQKGFFLIGGAACLYGDTFADAAHFNRADDLSPLNISQETFPQATAVEGLPGVNINDNRSFFAPSSPSVVEMAANEVKRMNPSSTGIRSDILSDISVSDSDPVFQYSNTFVPNTYQSSAPLATSLNPSTTTEQIPPSQSQQQNAGIASDDATLFFNSQNDIFAGEQNTPSSNEAGKQKKDVNGELSFANDYSGYVPFYTGISEYIAPDHDCGCDSDSVALPINSDASGSLDEPISEESFRQFAAQSNLSALADYITFSELNDLAKEEAMMNKLQKPAQFSNGCQNDGKIMNDVSSYSSFLQKSNPFKKEETCKKSTEENEIVSAANLAAAEDFAAASTFASEANMLAVDDYMNASQIGEALHFYSESQLNLSQELQKKAEKLKKKINQNVRRMNNNLKKVERINKKYQNAKMNSQDLSKVEATNAENVKTSKLNKKLNRLNKRKMKKLRHQENLLKKRMDRNTEYMKSIEKMNQEMNELLVKAEELEILARNNKERSIEFFKASENAALAIDESAALKISADENVDLYLQRAQLARDGKLQEGADAQKFQGDQGLQQNQNVAGVPPARSEANSTPANTAEGDNNPLAHLEITPEFLNDLDRQVQEAQELQRLLKEQYKEQQQKKQGQTQSITSTTQHQNAEPMQMTDTNNRIEEQAEKAPRSSTPTEASGSANFFAAYAPQKKSANILQSMKVMRERRNGTTSQGSPYAASPSPSSSSLLLSRGKRELNSNAPNNFEESIRQNPQQTNVFAPKNISFTDPQNSKRLNIFFHNAYGQ